MPLAKVPHVREYVRLLRQNLPDEKVQHCVFVAEYLSSFAPSLGLSHDDAAVAGLLHDLCRAMPPADLLAQAEEYGIPILPYHEQKPILLHGPLAAEKVKRDLGIDNPDIYEAIYWHTTGKAGYGLLGQALYFADFAEPGRHYPEAASAREILRTHSFPKALCYAADVKVNYFKRAPALDPHGKEFYAWLKEIYPNP